MQVEGKVESKVLIFGVQTQFSKHRQLLRVMLPGAFTLSPAVCPAERSPELWWLGEVNGKITCEALSRNDFPSHLKFEILSLMKSEH